MFATTIVCAGSHFIARLADQGLANTLGLVTLRHGTNPVSWLGIHILGAMPSMGDSKFGGDYHIWGVYSHQNKNRFYFAKGNNDEVPRQYARWSTKNLFKGICGIKMDPLAEFIGTVLPTIKFRFPHDKVETLKQDPTIPSACSTDQRISPLNIGLLGTLSNGISVDAPKRMQINKPRVLLGIAQLAFCAAVTFIALNYLAMFIAAHKTAVLVGTIFAVV